MYTKYDRVVKTEKKQQVEPFLIMHTCIPPPKQGVRIKSLKCKRPASFKITALDDFLAREIVS